MGLGLTEEKFTAIRKRLDQLGYRQTLDLASVPLVEKLFADLIHTTESLKATKQQSAAMREESQAIIQQGDPYKAENTRLLRENNDLHIQIIKIKEDTDAKVKDLKNALRKSEHECADLQFLNSQYAHKLKALQKQDQAKSDRIQQLHERNMNAVVETPGGRRRHIAPRRPVLELNSTIPGSPAASDPGSPVKTTVGDPYMADLLRVADNQIAELNRQMKSMEDANGAAQRKCENLGKQVTLRDKEIDRLQHLLEGGRPTKAMLNDGLAESTDRVISHLNIQVEYLQQTNRELDAKLRASLGKQREEMEGSKGLQSKLSELQQKHELISEELEKMKMEKSARLGTYETELDMIFDKMKDKENEAREEKAQQIALCERVEQYKQEKKELIKLLTESQVETEKFELVVRRLEEDKREAGRQIRELNEENKQLKRSVNSLEHITDLKTASLEQQKSRAEVNLQDRIDQLSAENDSNKDRITILMKEVEEGQRDANLKSEEMLYYKQECANLQSLVSKFAIPARDTEPLSQLEKVAGERDKALRQITELKEEMITLRSNIRMVTSERDNIDALYLQVTDEVKRLRSEKSVQLMSESNDVLRSERDTAISKLKQALADKERLAEQLGLEKQTGRLELEQLEDKSRDQERRVHSLTAERDLLSNKVTNLKETVRKLEEQVANSSNQLYTAKAGQTHTESQVSHLRTVASTAQRSRDDLHAKLQEVSMELELANQRNAFLDKQVNDLQDSLRGKNTTSIKMKQTLVEKEKDRDTLLAQLDEKTEKLFEMNQKFLKQQNELQVLTMEIKSFEDRFKEQKMQSGQKVQEVEGLRKQITRMVEEISQLEAVRDRAVTHNKELTTDLSNMTGENQRLHEEARGLKKELELLRKEVNERAAELHSIHHVVGLKDADNADILARYQEINVECDRLAREAKVGAENCRALQRDLAATADVRDALERRLGEQAREVQRLVSGTEELMRAVNEGELREEELRGEVARGMEERAQIQADLETVREINSRIEGQREAHARQAANRGVEVEQLQRVIENLSADCESLKRQVAAEKDCARNLEFIIKTSRQQEFDNQTSVEDMHGQVNHLKAKLQMKETELAGFREKYRTVCNEQDKLKQENATLLRSVTDERFEREKARNESNILKHKLAASTTSSPVAPIPASTEPPSLYERPVVVDFEPTLSPSVVRRRTARRHRVSSADETDDSIMREINRSMKSKLAAAAGPTPSNVSSIMTSLTETSIEDQTLESERPTEHSIDSVDIRGKPSTGLQREVKDSVVESELSRHSSVVVDDGISEATFDGDEDDSVYQAIKSSQRSGGSTAGGSRPTN